MSLAPPSLNFAGSGISGGTWSGPLTQPDRTDSVARIAYRRMGSPNAMLGDSLRNYYGLWLIFHFLNRLLPVRKESVWGETSPVTTINTPSNKIIES
jgi:hypothetical protein